MTVKLVTEHNLKFLSSKESDHPHRNIIMSICHVVGNLISRFNHVELGDSCCNLSYFVVCKLISIASC